MMTVRLKLQHVCRPGLASTTACDRLHLRHFMASKACIWKTLHLDLFGETQRYMQSHEEETILSLLNSGNQQGGKILDQAVYIMLH